MRRRGKATDWQQRLMDAERNARVRAGDDPAAQDKVTVISHAKFRAAAKRNGLADDTIERAIALTDLEQLRLQADRPDDWWRPRT